MGLKSIFRKVFPKKTGSPSENPTFIRLVQLMQKDPKFREVILLIINLDSFNRSSMINTLIHEQKLKGVPEEHLATLKFLADDDICKKIKSLL